MAYMNPMLNQLSRAQAPMGNVSSLKNNLNNVKSMMNMMKGAKNPNMLLQQLMMNNPNLRNVMDYVKNNGGDARTAFYKMAEEKGVDPNEILNMLK